MYLYTPKKSLLDDFLRAKKKGMRPGARNNPHALARQWLRSQDYNAIHVFCRYWPGTKHYSVNRLREVPVNGELYSVDFFDETKIE